MSSIASLYVFRKEQIEELSKIAAQLPREEIPEGAQVMVALVPEDQVEAMTAPYEPFWNFIHDNGDDKEFEFNWGGLIMDRALLYLREKDIDLSKAKQLPTGSHDFVFLIYDKKDQDKFLSKLDPKTIDKDDLHKWIDEYAWGTPPEGILDAIQNLHTYFGMIDDEHEVLLHTDWLAGVTQTKPMKEITAGPIKQRMLQYFCEECGNRMSSWGGSKRVSEIPDGECFTCGDMFMITTMRSDGKDTEEKRECTFRSEEHCKAPATGCYRAVM